MIIIHPMRSIVSKKLGFNTGSAELDQRLEKQYSIIFAAYPSNIAKELAKAAVREVNAYYAQNPGAPQSFDALRDYIDSLNTESNSNSTTDSTESQESEDNSSQTISNLTFEPQTTIQVSRLTQPIVFGNVQVIQVVLGTTKSDVITGTSDNDALAGFEGKDQLSGGGGPDAFLFIAPGEFGKKSLDIITDFNSDEGDKLVISRGAFDGVKGVVINMVNGKQDAKKAASSNKTFIYDEKSGVLYFNENGKKNGFGDGGEFVKLLGAPGIDNRDFVIV